MVFNGKNKKLLRTGFGVPLAFGAANVAVGSIPVSVRAGQAASQALGRSTGMVGLTTKVSLLGVGLNVLKKSIPTKIKMKRRR